MLYFVGATDRKCENCNKIIKSPAHFLIYRFSTGVGVEICSKECGKEYRKKMKRQNYIGHIVSK